VGRPGAGLRTSAVRLGRVLEMRGQTPDVHRVPPVRHVQNGAARRSRGRGGPEAEGPRFRGAEGDRRVHHARGGVRAHERADHHDRRKRIGYDQRRLGRGDRLTRTKNKQKHNNNNNNTRVQTIICDKFNVKYK